MSYLKSLTTVCAAVLFAGCMMKTDKAASHGEPAKPVATPATPAAQSAAEPKPAADAPKLTLASILTADRIYFRDGGGGKQFQFKPKEADAVKFYDAAGAELCKLTMHPDKLKVKDAADKPLFELKWHADKVAFKDATDKELGKLRFHGKDLDYVANESTKAKIIHEEGAYRVEDAEGKKLAMLTIDGGHAKYASADDAHVLTCDKTSNPLALVGFALPDLTPAQQAAVFIYFVSRPEK